MSEPALRRIVGDIEMDDSSSVMSEDDQGVEKPKRRGRNNEHVDRRNVGQVVMQKATPGGGGDFGPPRQVSADRGLADLDAELEQFAVDAGGRPRADWPGSSGGSDHGSRCSSWAVPDGVTATASRAGSLCDATGPRLLV